LVAAPKKRLGAERLRVGRRGIPQDLGGALKGANKTMSDEEDRGYARYTTEQLESLLKQSADSTVSQSIARELAKRYKTTYDKVAERVRTEGKFGRTKYSSEEEASAPSRKPKKRRTGRIVVLAILLIAVAVLAALYGGNYYHRDDGGEVQGP
jgi:hypothetical protein